MKIQTQLTKDLEIQFPVIMAPMFLVSNVAMVKAAMDSGIVGTFPTLNYRDESELADVLDQLNEHKAKTKSKGNYGVNLIVQKSNPFYEKHLELCIQKKVPFFITSLGNPAKTIERGHAYGAKVYCDVTNIVHATKVKEQGADGLIAVGQGAGGHAGPAPLQLLIPALRREFPDLPIVAAGGVANGEGLLSMLTLGAAGVSMGTRFIACNEATVSDEYKNAVVNSKMTDIVLTERLSGTPSAIINTPYAKKIGTKQNFFEKMLSKNQTTKKYFKMLVQVRGMKKLEKSVKPGGYKNLWGAGQSVELIDEVLPTDQIIRRLEQETEQAYTKLKDLFV